jgi:hypothetical protein
MGSRWYDSEIILYEDKSSLEKIGVLLIDQLTMYHSHNNSQKIETSHHPSLG